MNEEDAGIATPQRATGRWGDLAHKKATQLLFSDLVELSREDPALFTDLYYNRGDELAKFCSIMNGGGPPIEGLPNVLIVGDAGVGKSNFMHRLAIDEQLLARHALFPIVVDFNSVAPRDHTGCKLYFIDRVKDYFEVAGCPINNLHENIKGNIEDNLYKVTRHLQETRKETLKKYLIIFLDDFDYAETEWHLLLDFFRPFVSSNRVSVVFSIRPPLIAAIDSYDDRFRRFYLSDVQRIELGVLNVANILTSRLAPFLVEHKEVPFYRHIMHLFQPESSVSRVLRKLGIRQLSDLPHFEYPFTQGHNAFMQRITNGNLREIFEIALVSLDFVLLNVGNLETRMEDALPRKVIGRENVLKLFCDASDRTYSMLNLHKYKSPKGNSLLYNTIEAVKLLGRADETFVQTLRQLGHQKRDVEWALTFLCDRSQRLINPLAIHSPVRTRVLEEFPEYEVSEKANYYLQIAEWAEYISRFGAPGQRLTKTHYG
jgi:hypothetical protein